MRGGLRARSSDCCTNACVSRLGQKRKFAFVKVADRLQLRPRLRYRCANDRCARTLIFATDSANGCFKVVRSID